MQGRPSHHEMPPPVSKVPRYIGASRSTGGNEPWVALSNARHLCRMIPPSRTTQPAFANMTAAHRHRKRGRSPPPLPSLHTHTSADRARAADGRVGFVVRDRIMHRRPGNTM
ncbi:uncharacterized protein LY79DRAFT_564954 [Colletotrichum navitas]|uniref:Uncharacterized protein n=1 Tax=Colletotrichum navitas TaxID=681940 RepID=A0AAD8V0J3_9PEZI|nr:uncharacterized protein LY79DRAFT_564954 [Colletotrichum navitas]KAK1579171.1 hypothetical protein LY79DRAFT_564954 [Colletotrichum navitas]